MAKRKIDLEILGRELNLVKQQNISLLTEIEEQKKQFQDLRGRIVYVTEGVQSIIDRGGEFEGQLNDIKFNLDEVSGSFDELKEDINSIIKKLYEKKK